MNEPVFGEVLRRLVNGERVEGWSFEVVKPAWTDPWGYQVGLLATDPGGRRKVYRLTLEDPGDDQGRKTSWSDPVGEEG
ncbi:hypothetical protein OWR29_45265 [Actinoplanes sp. Pm04-4]|uniref:Uncharacterized protein n=1 Tax=Paractinoplanes pyxinae TaxID=2997416 RepID=A0ABT4BFD4_9ACTN|nr:hypothetical protein [Actinoplanes pyxinae]MCY1145256.1 hypothetical protein [Actinoplanes pyxinae]